MPSYYNPLLSAHALTKRRPSGWNTCHQCGKSHEWDNCPTYGKTCDKCRILIISKPFVVPRLQQPRQQPALTGARSHSHHWDEHLLGKTVVMAKEVESITRRRRCQRRHQNRKHTRLHSRIQRWSYKEQHLVGKMVMYHKTQSFQERYQKRKVHITGFLALQSIVKWLIAPTLRVSL